MRYKHPATAINGVISWLQNFDEIRAVNKQDHAVFKRLNTVIKDYLRHCNEPIPRRGRGHFNDDKAAMFIQKDFNKFTNWYMKNRENYINSFAK